MLGGLAMKRKWSNARKAAGKSTEKPNLVLSSAVQVCWEKFCNYFEVEARFVPISLEHKVLDGYELEKYVDENTIGVVCIMGVTYTGMYEPVKEVSAKLDQIQKDTGLDIPIHVDGASGGFIAPFCQPDLGGTSASIASFRSTPPATSTAWCTRAWAGSCGATRRPAPTI